MGLRQPTGRARRKKRIRRKITGTPERPRLTVYRSLRHIYAQIVDDTQGRTLVAASTLEKEHEKGGRNKSQAAAIGKKLAERARAAKVEEIVFDRNGYIFHGCIKELADAAREGGLRF